MKAIYKIEWMQEYIGYAEIEANSKEEAINKFRDDDYCETDYQVSGKKYIQSLTKNGKQLNISDFFGTGY